MQNITVSNLLNRLESLHFCTYAETKEYYETLRESHLPKKLKFWKGRYLVTLMFQSSTLLIENYSQKQCHCSQNQCLKYDLKKQTESSKTKKDFVPVTSKAPFLTLTQITLNFKCYRKGNNSKKKYNLYNTKRASNKQSQSCQWVKLKSSSEIINSNSRKKTPFMKLSCEEQKHLFTSSSSWARYNLMIIRFCLFVAAKSLYV